MENRFNNTNENNLSNNLFEIKIASYLLRTHCAIVRLNDEELELLNLKCGIEVK